MVNFTRTIEFGEWLPDQPVTDSALSVCTNVLPQTRGYKSFPSAQTPEPAPPPLPAPCRGLFQAIDDSGSVVTFAGTSTDLYRLDGITWTLVSKTGGYTNLSNGFWNFASFGNQVIAVNGLNLPQIYEMGLSTNFADLTGAPIAKDIAIVRDFVVLGNLVDFDGTQPRRIAWSGFNDFTVWANPPTTITTAQQADYQDVEGIGNLQTVVGGEKMVAFYDLGVVIGTYIGSPLVFQFDRVFNALGTKSPQSVCQQGDSIFYLAQDGFYEFRGAQSMPIGYGKVDKFFFNDVDIEALDQVIGAVRVQEKCVLFSYKSNDSPTGGNNRTLVYNYAVGRWSLVNLALEYFIIGQNPSVPTDSMLPYLPLPLDSISPTFLTDDNFFTQTNEVPLLINDDGQLQYLNGASLPATITTGEFQPSDGARTLARAVRPVVENTASFVRLYYRSKQSEAAQSTLSVPENVYGECNFRVDSRFFRVEMTTASGINFDSIYGFQYDATRTGTR